MKLQDTTTQQTGLADRAESKLHDWQTLGAAQKQITFSLQQATPHHLQLPNKR